MSMNSGAPHRRIGFEPGLDGLRGLAVLGTLCYHAQFSWAQGGFLAIPTFFTLTGYLITSLFLSEWKSDGRVDLLAFWARRFRRLMPGALLTLLLMSAFGLFFATPSQVRSLAGDVQWALFYGANWHFLFSNASYAAMFEAPSPVQHFWSLAIEEQFYFVFPLMAFAVLWIGKGSRRALGGTIAGLVVASSAASVLLTLSGAPMDRVYYGTDTRAVELLLGALLAVLLPAGTRLVPGRQRFVEHVGSIALVAMLLGWSIVDLNSDWLYLGGLSGYSLLSVTVIAAAVQPTGAVRKVLSLPAIRWVGRVSYGAYLFHWPIYLVLSPERTGLDGLSLFALRLTLTFALAWVSFRWFESPIRSGKVLTRWRPYVVMPLAFAAVWFAVDRVPQPESIFKVDLEAMDAFVEQAIRGHVPPTDPPPPSLFNDVPRIAVFGDSTALRLSVGLHFLQSQTGTTRFSRGATRLGCGVAREGLIRTGAWEHRKTNCSPFDVSWARSIRVEQPDIALVLSAGWDIRDRQLPGDTEWRAIGDPVLDRYLRTELLAATDTLSADGSLVIWLTHPAVVVKLFGKAPEFPYPSSNPERIERWNAMIFELEKARPGKVRVIDLRGYMQTLPGGEMNEDYRPDENHLSPEAAYQVAKDWLVDEILRAYREQAAIAASNRSNASTRSH